jgi:SagB-type dehydrogenase family enzyme
MAPSGLILSFPSGLSVQPHSGNASLTLQLGGHSMTLPEVTDGLTIALQLLTTGVSLQDLGHVVQDQDGVFAKLKLFYLLRKFAHLAWIRYAIVLEGQPFTTVIPMAKMDFLTPSPSSPQRPVVVSRFAYCHAVGGEMILESPLCKAQIILNDGRSLALIGYLAQPQTVVTLADQMPAVPPSILHLWVDLLCQLQILTEVGETAQATEETDPALAQWEFHDLLFHTRSRTGRHTNPTGGTYRFQERFEPLPFLKSISSGSVIPLPRPDLALLCRQDLPLSQVLEARTSIRQYGKHPIRIEQLGEFLYRTARVKSRFPTDQGELSHRPYPSAGALYELELYLVIHACTGLEAGFYHYDPQEHHVSWISDPSPLTQQLLHDACWATGQPIVPQVLIIVTARFQRLSWKYQSIAYALMLKHVGALYQTMYLVATAMHLAPCALGSGHSDLFAEAAGTNYYAETSIGEFILGSHPHSE